MNMHSLKFLSFLLLALLVQPMMAQDDDFFLQGEEEEETEVLESSQFTEDDGDYLDDIVRFPGDENLRVLDYAYRSYRCCLAEKDVENHRSEREDEPGF